MEEELIQTFEVDILTRLDSIKASIDLVGNYIYLLIYIILILLCFYIAYKYLWKSIILGNIRRYIKLRI